MSKILMIIFVSIVTLKAEWYVTSNIDEMEGTKICSAQSLGVFSTQPMEFPYKNTESHIIYTVDGKGNELLGFKFSKGPNIMDENFRNGQKVATRRVKFDDEIKRYTMFRPTTGKVVYVDTILMGKDFIPKMKKSSTLLTEFNWYRIGNVYFRHNLKGFEKAYIEARQKCGI